MLAEGCCSDTYRVTMHGTMNTKLSYINLGMFQHGEINTPADAALGFLVVLLQYQMCIAAIRLKHAVN